MAIWQGLKEVYAYIVQKIAEHPSVALWAFIVIILLALLGRCS